MIDEAQEHAEDALATAGTDDEPARALAILALSTVALRRGEYTAALAQLDEVDGAAAAAEGPLVPCLTELRRAEALGMLGRLDEAAVLLRDNLERQRRERRACLEGAWLAMGSHLRFMAGALEDAVDNAEAAEALGFPFSATPGGAGAMLARLQVALHTGDSKRRRAALTTAHRTHADGGPAAHWDATWVFALASGDARRGGPPARRRGAVGPARSRLPPPPRPARARRGQSRAGRPRRRGRLGVARANPGVPLLAGLAAHTRGLVDRDARELVRAADLLEGTQRPLAQASALEDAGRVIGDVDRLSAAFELYSSIGATVDAKRTASRLREHGVRLRVTRPAPAEGWDSLTESELRVVRLVGSGASNRRAAERLYLSPHTVSTHLRHAFVKLQINSRVELARLLHEHDVPALAP